MTRHNWTSRARASLESDRAVDGSEVLRSHCYRLTASAVVEEALEQQITFGEAACWVLQVSRVTLWLTTAYC
jgi:hypothetical protein